MCKGARITHLHPCCTTSQHLLQRKANKYHCYSLEFATTATTLQNNCHSLDHMTVNVNKTITISLSEAKQTKLPSIHEEEKLLTQKSNKQVINTCKHLQTVSCHSHSVNYATAEHFQALPDIFQV